MGCDGGTIPTRDELVRLKKKPEKKDQDSVRAFNWKHCAMSQEPLSPPIVACQLGRLYSKESVIELLLDRTKFQGRRFDHIKTLKDVKVLELTPNPAFKTAESDKGGVYIDRNISQFICPISGLEMSGKYRFCYLHKCGCVFAERALKEIKTETCNKCGDSYKKADLVIINGNEEDLTLMQERMTERKLQAKLEKKSRKKRAAVEETVTTEEGPSTSKKVKEDDESEKPTGKSKVAEGATASKLGASKLTSGATDKKGRSVQKDPKASEVYKSIFTSHEKCKNQQQAHWVTHNPFYM